MPTTETKTAPVSERALIGRINRKLASEEEVLRVAKDGGRLHQNFGRYYVLDYRTNNVVAYHFDLAEYAKEAGCLADWEHLEAD